MTSKLFQEWIEQTDPMRTKRFIRRPNVDNPIPQDMYPWQATKKCRQIWYIEGRQLPNQLFRRDRVVTRKTPVWWNHIYTASAEQDRAKAIAMKSPERVEFGKPRHSVLADFAAIIVDVKRRHPDLAMEETLLQWYDPIGMWWEWYIKHYFHADPEIQQVFYERFKYIDEHRRVEVMEFRNRLPIHHQDFPWCAAPRDTFQEQEDWLSAL